MLKIFANWFLVQHICLYRAVQILISGGKTIPGSAFMIFCCKEVVNSSTNSFTAKPVMKDLRNNECNINKASTFKNFD